MLIESSRVAESEERRAARIVELGQQIAMALGTPPMPIEDLYDERGLPI